ncbi:MAG TPA: TonB-dependent receptor [Azospirillaceae bacterium]|nr:TonB-dependent receptor [Azospirillaceae bacterium]
MKRSKILAGAMAAALLGGHGSARSQELEEVVVTAQKRAQSLQDVGVAITALSGDRLQEMGMRSTTDIVSQVPSLQVSKFSPAVTVFNIRGVSQNDFSAHLEGPVAVYMDEAYVSALGGLDNQMFDLERVEILRGPQGTLFGRNATGGLIHFVSRKPEAVPDGYLQATAGEFGQRQLEGAVGGALGDGMAARASFSLNRQDGYLENRIGRDVHGARNYAGRVQLLVDVGADADFLLNVRGSKNDDEPAGGYSHAPAARDADGLGRRVAGDEDFYGTCAGCDPYGYREPDDDPHTGSFDREGFFDRSTRGITGRLRWDVGGAELVALSDYIHLKKRYGEDTDGSPNAVLNYDTRQTFDQVSQEMRLSGDGEGLRWVGGAYYLDIRTRDAAAVALPLFGARYDTRWGLRTRSWALFGQAEADLAPDWTVIAGARYTDDDKRFRFRQSEATLGELIRFDATRFPDLAARDFRDVNAKAELDWRPVDDVLAYASVNRGTKGGNWAAPVLPSGPVEGIERDLPHDKEVLTSYELGVKSTVLGGSTRINAAAFYYDYDDYQAFTLQNVSQSIGNRNAVAKGFELELTTAPAEGLEVQLGVSLLDGEVEDIRLPEGGTADRDLPQMPGLGLNGLVRYAWPVLGGEAVAQGDFKYSDSFYFTVLNSAIDREPSYLVGNLRLSFTSGDERWQAALFVNNVTDERYRTYTLDASALGFALDSFAPPRWFGASIAYRWG